MDCLYIYTPIVLMDWGIDFKFILMDPSLLFALLTILLMCGFQEMLFDSSTSMCVATGTALSVSLCYCVWVINGCFRSGDVHNFTFGGVESHLPRLCPVD